MSDVSDTCPVCAPHPDHGRFACRRNGDLCGCPGVVRTPDVPQRWAEMGAVNMKPTHRGQHVRRYTQAARVLAPVLDDLRRQVAALEHTQCQSRREYVYGPGDRRWESTGLPCDCPLGDVLYLLTTGGTDA